MRLTKQTNHAIRILIHCASEEELVKVAAISDQLDITQQNVFKIVHLLTRAGFLKAVRGRHGGVRLARAPEDIRIGDIVRATESSRLGIDTEEQSDAAATRALPISNVLDDALEAFISVLDQHTLQDMAKNASATPKVKPDQPQRKKVQRPAAATTTARAGTRN